MFWDQPHCVVAKADWYRGELLPCLRFIVTNLHRPTGQVVPFYSGQDTTEQWIEKGKNAVRWTQRV